MSMHTHVQRLSSSRVKFREDAAQVALKYINIICIYIYIYIYGHVPLKVAQTVLRVQYRNIYT